MTVHAAAMFRPDENPPLQEKGKHHELRYLGNEKWALKEDDYNLKVYNSSDLRMTLVYRSRCFESKEASIKYK